MTSISTFKINNVYLNACSYFLMYDYFHLLYYLVKKVILSSPNSKYIYYEWTQYDGYKIHTRVHIFSLILIFNKMFIFRKLLHRIISCLDRSKIKTCQFISIDTLVKFSLLGTKKVQWPRHVIHCFFINTWYSVH